MRKRTRKSFKIHFLASSTQAENRQKMNERKEGAHFAYPNSFLNMLGAIHAYLLPYRQLEGFVRLFSRHVKELKGNVPDFTTIWWRVTKIVVELDPKVNLNEKITIAVDSTGIKVTNRGEWIKEKWLKERRGFVKIHVAVDTKSKQIVSMKVTQEDTGDAKMMKPLLEEASRKAHIKKDNFQTLDNMKIEPVIKVRSNSVVTGKCIPRDNSVLEQLSYPITKNGRRNTVMECVGWRNQLSPLSKEPSANQLNLSNGRIW